VDLLEQLYNHSSMVSVLVKEVETANWPVRPAPTNCKTQPQNLQAQKRLDPEQVAELVAAFVDGEAIKQLATQYGINRTTVLAHLKRQGVRRRRTKLMPADIDRVIELYAASWTIEDIGASFELEPRQCDGLCSKPGSRSDRG
jgi:uncharacterized protein (DUF433 family)